MKKLFLAATIIIATITSACSTTSIINKDNISNNKETVKAALNGAFATHDVSAVDQYFADPYIQHNPLAPSGVAALRGMVAHMAKGPKGGVNIHRILGDGDLIATHSTYTGFGPVPLVAMDVFRFDKNGKIVEHWDNMSPISKPNPSGRTQTDGTTEITDLDKTVSNKAKVSAFITKSMINHAH